MLYIYITNIKYKCKHKNNNLFLYCLVIERRNRQAVDESEKALIEALKENVESNPIDGYLLRLGESLRRLSCKKRSQLEIEFLKRLYEVEEEEGI